MGKQIVFCIKHEINIYATAFFLNCFASLQVDPLTLPALLHKLDALSNREVHSVLILSASQGGLVMSQIIVTAEVNDVEEWLKFKAEMVPAM